MSTEAGCLQAKATSKAKAEEPRAHTMDALAEELENKLHRWKSEIAADVRERIAEIMELADHDALDLSRSGCN